jgi:DNA-binding NarL/FixJ family response regulator
LGEPRVPEEFGVLLACRRLTKELERYGSGLEAFDRGELAAERILEAHSAVTRAVMAFEIAASALDRQLVSGRPLVLTDDQVDLLRLVASGLTNRQIARRCGCSESAIKSRIARLERRLGLSRRVDLAIFAREQGLGLEAL